MPPNALRIILLLVAGACASAATRMPYAYYKLISFVVIIAWITLKKEMFFKMERLVKIR